LSKCLSRLGDDRAPHIGGKWTEVSGKTISRKNDWQLIVLLAFLGCGAGKIGSTHWQLIGETGTLYDTETGNSVMFLEYGNPLAIPTPINFTLLNGTGYVDATDTPAVG
jgi:hypothetical protein